MATLPFFFACASCGEIIQSQEGLAEQSVKCPSCGQLVTVPPSGPDILPGPAWKSLLAPLILAFVLTFSFVLKLHNVDHTALTRWDEAFHAVVARNVLKHPLKPTLVDVPYLPYDTTKWGENHVWLHKPILPFWQVALCFAILGVNTFALRLPAVVLSTGAAWLTYLIGKQLLERRAALLAASVQAFSPFVMTLVHGYQFADNIDVALLFWVEVGIYFLVRGLHTGGWRFFLLAGLAQGLAFLSKSYLAGIILGVALTGWLLPVVRLGRREDCKISFPQLAALLGVTLVTIAPWMVYCALAFPEEFRHEHAQICRHLHANVENWAAPWDRLVFDYLIAMYGVFYTPVLVAAVVLLGKALMQRHAGLWLVYAWGFGVVVPHLFAVTKTPSATLLALPAFLLLLGALISEAWRGARWPLAALTAVLVLCVFFPAVINSPGHGYPALRAFGGVMRQSLWVIGHVAGALAAAALFVAGSMVVRKHLDPAPARYLHIAALGFCVCVLSWLGFQTIRAAWRVTSAESNDPASVAVGEFARTHLPDNAVLFVQEWRGVEHLTTMFYADRTCYPLKRAELDESARQVIAAGGIPYVVSHQRLAWPVVFIRGKLGLAVYQWQP